MSQVIVTNDSLREKRKNSLAEERKIDHSSSFQRWQLPVGKAAAVLEKSLGLLAVPLAAFWALLLSFLSLGLAATLVIFRALALLFPKSSRKP